MSHLQRFWVKRGKSLPASKVCSDVHLHHRSWNAGCASFKGGCHLTLTHSERGSGQSGWFSMWHCSNEMGIILAATAFTYLLAVLLTINGMLAGFGYEAWLYSKIKPESPKNGVIFF